MTTKDQDIQQYKKAARHLATLGDKLANKPWRTLAAEGLKSYAVFNCMNQEGLPIGEARRKVREVMREKNAKEDHVGEVERHS